MNIASGIVTFILLLASAVGWFFFLLLALNGFSERDTTPSLVFFAVWTLLAAVVLGAGSFFLTKFLIARSFNAILALILSVTAAVGIGFIADFGGLIASTIVASEMRNGRMK